MLYFLAIWTFLPAQNQEAFVRGLDEYVHFTNESIHGMLIAHRLFENFNQDINQYVDLPGHQLNFYDNSDLPLNIFEDPDQWFYEISPQQLYFQTQQNNFQLSDPDFQLLQESAREIRQTTIRCNSLRLKLGESMNTVDLNNRDSLYLIYDQLESAVDAFDLLYARWIILGDQLDDLEKQLSPSVSPDQELSGLLKSLHKQSVKILQSVKGKMTKDLPDLLKTLETNRKALDAYRLKGEYPPLTANAARSWKRKISENIQALIKTTEAYLSGTPVPDEYALYGDSYYYFNTQLINKINRYGNGIAPQINTLVDLLNLPMVHRLEMPHYLEIIYPKKVEKLVPLIVASQPEINETPLVLENRTVFTSENMHVIYVDDPEPTLEIFDHLQQDGDIISLNFNGDWIYENLSLERNPRKFKLKLNKSGKNFLILHAINEGSVPPNTIGINYVHKGRKKRYIMQSNLKTSQLVEIKLDK